MTLYTQNAIKKRCIFALKFVRKDYKWMCLWGIVCTHMIFGVNRGFLRLDEHSRQSVISRSKSQNNSTTTRTITPAAAVDNNKTVLLSCFSNHFKQPDDRHAAWRDWHQTHHRRSSCWINTKIHVSKEAAWFRTQNGETSVSCQVWCIREPRGGGENKSQTAEIDELGAFETHGDLVLLCCRALSSQREHRTCTGEHPTPCQHRDQVMWRLKSYLRFAGKSNVAFAVVLRWEGCWSSASCRRLHVSEAQTAPECTAAPEQLIDVHVEQPAAHFFLNKWGYAKTQVWCLKHRDKLKSFAPPQQHREQQWTTFASAHEWTNLCFLVGKGSISHLPLKLKVTDQWYYYHYYK